MANFVYTYAHKLMLTAGLNFTSHDIRILLVDNTTTADTEKDAETISDFTTLGELSGTGYTRKALASEAVNQDDPNLRAEFDAADVTWTLINAGTAAGALIYRFVTNDADSVPIAFIDSVFPITTNGSDFTIQWNAEGIIQL